MSKDNVEVFLKSLLKNSVNNYCSDERNLDIKTKVIDSVIRAVPIATYDILDNNNIQVDLSQNNIVSFQLHPLVIAAYYDSEEFKYIMNNKGGF